MEPTLTDPLHILIGSSYLPPTHILMVPTLTTPPPPTHIAWAAYGIILHDVVFSM